MDGGEQDNDGSHHRRHVMFHDPTQRYFVALVHRIEAAPEEAVQPTMFLLVAAGGDNGCTSIGVRLNEMNPETRIATQMVTENSRNSRPSIPLMKSTGIKAATNEMVMETIVKPISLAPLTAAS